MQQSQRRGRHLRPTARRTPSGSSATTTASRRRRAVANVRHAIADGAVAIVDEGTGVDASWQRANARRRADRRSSTRAGATSWTPQTRPNVFRIVPTDHGLAFRFAEYLLPTAPEGRRSCTRTRGTARPARRRCARRSRSTRRRSRRASRLSADALRRRAAVAARPAGRARPRCSSGAGRRRSRAPCARPGGAAGTCRSSRRRTPPTRSCARSSSDHPEWLDGLTFADGRLTAEVGPGPFYAFVDALRSRLRPPRRSASRRRTGQPVYAAPEYAMYASDFVNVLAAAVRRAGGRLRRQEAGRRRSTRSPCAAPTATSAASTRTTTRASSTTTSTSRVFHDMTFQPVQDDPLSATLPALRQVP